MKHTYHISGMTCTSCETIVKNSLSILTGVSQVEVDLEKKRVSLVAEKKLIIDDLRKVLPKKYSISKSDDLAIEQNDVVAEKSKFAQLKPLMLIFLYLFSAVILMHYKDGNVNEAMLDFMGLFYIVFSFFKLLDLKGFPETFRMYDPLAKILPVYSWAYPFVELALGVLFLMRFQVTTALLITVVILGTTTIGVTRTLLHKKKIRCACLGTALQLPMTEATLIENSIMLVMAFAMLTNQYM